MVVDGAPLTFETLASGTHAGEVVRVDEAHDTLLRVVAGLVRVTVGEDECVLAAGEEAVIRAGAAHRLASVAGDARVLSGRRPLRR